jgi:hypothetical protein
MTIRGCRAAEVTSSELTELYDVLRSPVNQAIHGSGAPEWRTDDVPFMAGARRVASMNRAEPRVPQQGRKTMEATQRRAAQHNTAVASGRPRQTCR